MAPPSWPSIDTRVSRKFPAPTKSDWSSLFNWETYLFMEVPERTECHNTRIATKYEIQKTILLWHVSPVKLICSSMVLYYLYNCAVRVWRYVYKSGCSTILSKREGEWSKFWSRGTLADRKYHISILPGRLRVCRENFQRKADIIDTCSEAGNGR